MIGDDATSTFIAILLKLLEILRNRENARGRNEKHTPKIKAGKLTKKQFEKLLKNGVNMKFISVPAAKSAEIEKEIMKYGGTVYDAQMTDSKTALLGVPESHLDLVNAVMKHIAAKEISENPDKFTVKDKESLVDKEDMKIANEVMEKYDIPMYSFETNDNKYMNVVPKEYEGQYSSAMKEAAEIKKEVSNIEVTRYEQTAPLDNLEFKAFTASKEEANVIAKAAKENNLDVKFSEFEGKTVVLCNSNDTDKIKNAVEKYKESLKESENYLINIRSGNITLNKSLLVKEQCDNDSLFFRVPNTSMQDYIRLNVKDITEKGDSYAATLDSNKNYTIYNDKGLMKGEKSGTELLQFFNTKSPFANKDTKVFNYAGKPENGKIDIYNSKTNELINTNIDSAENIKAILKERQIDDNTINLLLNDINKNLDNTEKEIFNFTAEKSEVVYADIPNIGEYLAQSQLSETVIGKANCKGEIPKDNGSRCCVFDKAKNEYAILPILPKKEVQAKLSQMGYSEVSAKEIADKVVSSYRDTDCYLDEEKVKMPDTPEIKRFVGAELNNIGYVKTDDSVILLKDDNENYTYTTFDKNTPLKEIEKTLKDNFGIVDSKSVADAVNTLRKDRLIADSEKNIVREANVEKVTNDYINITNRENGESVMMPKDKIDTVKLLEIGVSAKTAETIKRSLQKSENNIETKNPFKHTLDELKSIAAEKVKSVAKSTEKSEITHETDKSEVR